MVMRSFTSRCAFLPSMPWIELIGLLLLIAASEIR